MKGVEIADGDESNTSGQGDHPAQVLSPDQRAGIAAYLRETPEGRAAMARYARESPEGRAVFDTHFRESAERCAELAAECKTDPAARERWRRHFYEIPGAFAAFKRSVVAEIERLQPTFWRAVRADTIMCAQQWMRPHQLTTRLQWLREVVWLAWASESFCCLLLYRLRVSLRVRRVPVVPNVLHRLCVMLAQLEIGDRVVIEPGVYIPHGKVVMDGVVRIGSGTMITPWVTIGLADSISGPTVGSGVMIGTGAKLLGSITIGDGARIGANAVVLTDVPPHATAVGVPARIVPKTDHPQSSGT